MWLFGALRGFEKCVCVLLLLPSFHVSSGLSVPTNRRLAQQQQQQQKKRSVDRVICSVGEYYDQIVEACSRCSDICRPNRDLTFCISNCQEFYLRYFVSTLPSPSGSHPSHNSAATAILSAYQVHYERLVDKPLFWTSVVSMTVAVAATITIIILCVRKRKMRSLGSQGARRMVTETGDSTTPADRSNETPGSHEPDLQHLLAHSDWTNSNPGDANCRINHQERNVAQDSESRPVTSHEQIRRNICGTDDFPMNPSPDKGPSLVPSPLSEIYRVKSCTISSEISPMSSSMTTSVYGAKILSSMESKSLCSNANNLKQEQKDGDRQKENWKYVQGSIPRPNKDTIGLDPSQGKINQSDYQWNKPEDLGIFTKSGSVNDRREIMAKIHWIKNCDLLPKQSWKNFQTTVDERFTYMKDHLK